MAVVRYLDRLKYIDYLISRKATGNQAAFAHKVNISKSLLKEYLRDMKDLGFPICYCRKRGTYYYQEEGAMVKRLFVRAEQ